MQRLCGDAVAELQQQNPGDFVIATGRQESVRRFIEITAVIGWGLIHGKEKVSELGRRADTGAVVIRIDPRCFRRRRSNSSW